MLTYFFFSIVTSEPSRFLIGSNKKTFTVHVAAITHHSKPLNDLIKEAKEGCAWLEDVDEYTFIRFSQYAYTGDYVATDHEILLDSSTIEIIPSRPTPSIDIEGLVAVAVEEPTAPGDVQGELIVDDPDRALAHSLNGASMRKKGKGKMSTGLMGYHSTGQNNSSSRKEKLWKLFESRSYPVLTPSFDPRENLESCEDYRDVLLCHARLYVFADKYEIGPLRRLSLSKLHKTLSVFPLHKERIEDIVELLRYSYANNVRRSTKDDRLTSLVIHYAACVVEDLVPNSKFKTILEERGELARDLVVKMVSRLE